MAFRDRPRETVDITSPERRAPTGMRMDPGYGAAVVEFWTFGKSNFWEEQRPTKRLPTPRGVPHSRELGRAW
eukprot:6794384-Prymnesium_polylepis.1